MGNVGWSDDYKVTIYLGEAGAILNVKNYAYSISNKRLDKITSKMEMRDAIKKIYSYDEFIMKILEVIDHGSEERWN